MKRIIILSLALYSFQVFSQITINSWQYLGPSEIIIMATDNNPSIVHTAAGPNQTWSYGELNSFEEDYVAFGPAQWYIGNQHFPSANYGIENDGSSVFFRKNDEAFDLIGIYTDIFETGTNTPTQFSPYQREIAFPMTYQQTWDNVSVMKLMTTDMTEFGGVGDSLVVTITTHRSAVVDSWGTITTPMGTFPTLRLYVKDSTIQNYKVFTFGLPIVNESETAIEHTYTFVTNDQTSKYNLLQYNYNPDEQIMSNVEWQMASPIASTEIDTSIEQPEIYPNPTQNEFKISNLHVGDKVSIISLSGQTFATYSISDRNLNFDISGLSNGTYTVLIQGKSGAYLRKLIVQK